MSSVNSNLIDRGLYCVDGLIGGDVLGKFNAIIDYGCEKIIFNK